MKNKKFLQWIAVFLVALGAFFLFEFFFPGSLFLKQHEKTFSVTKGESEQAIANDLAKQGIIRSPLFFRAYIFIAAKHGKLQVGNYAVSAGMSAAHIANMIAAGQSVKEHLTIIEGWTMQDIAHALAAKNICSAQDFTASIKKDWSGEFPFLKGVKSGQLEGYLFPDTYELSPGHEPDHLIEAALANFQNKLSPDLLQKIAAQHKSVHQVVIMASILEKEANTLDDKKIIAGILWKRIANGMPLQADSTVNYATGKSDPRASLNDIAMNSPYNTYQHYGLPPGPISNPGLDSIIAAIEPVKTNYWYYLAADGTGKTIFSSTLAQQQAAIKKYFGS